VDHWPRHGLAPQPQAYGVEDYGECENGNTVSKLFDVCAVFVGSALKNSTPTWQSPTSKGALFTLAVALPHQCLEIYKTAPPDIGRGLEKDICIIDLLIN
jgi:hypothetical protein